MEPIGVLLVVIVLIVITVIVIYNGIVSRKNAVERAWANVITQERQKEQILPKLEEIVDNFKAYESDLQKAVTRFRSNASALNAKEVDVTKLKDVERETAALLGGINLVAENYPDLKASDAYLSFMNEWSNQQENIGASIRIFNRNVEDFNSGIEMFPNNVVNALLNREKRIDVFSDSEAEESFEYKPNF